MLEEDLLVNETDKELTITGILMLQIIFRGIKEVAESIGISFGEILLLMYLNSRNKESSLANIKQDVMELSGASVTKVLDELVRKGFVEGRVNPVNRREKLIRITPDGIRMFNKAINEVSKLYNQFMLELSQSEKQRVLKSQKAMVANATELYRSNSAATSREDDTTLKDEIRSIANVTLLLSEDVLANDWNRPEEDEAWSHLQKVR